MTNQGQTDRIPCFGGCPFSCDKPVTTHDSISTLKRLDKTCPVPPLHALLSCSHIHRLCAAAPLHKRLEVLDLLSLSTTLYQQPHPSQITEHNHNGEDRHLPSRRHLPAVRVSNSDPHHHHLGARHRRHCHPEGDAHQQDRPPQLLCHIRHLWPLRSRCCSRRVSLSSCYIENHALCNS